MSILAIVQAHIFLDSRFCTENRRTRRKILLWLRGLVFRYSITLIVSTEQQTIDILKISPAPAHNMAWTWQVSGESS
jgi:hypothetical protein